MSDTKDARAARGQFAPGNAGSRNKQGARKLPLTLTLKPGLKELLEIAGADQFRSRSAQAEKYITDGLQRDGYVRPSQAFADVLEAIGSKPEEA